jgi:transcriptional regulator with XRE-family HTH domain
MRKSRKYHQPGSLGDIRIGLNLSQEEFAQKLGVSRSQVSMAESGKRSLPTAALLKLVELLKMKAEEENSAGGERRLTDDSAAK